MLRLNIDFNLNKQIYPLIKISILIISISIGWYFLKNTSFGEAINDSINNYENLRMKFAHEGLQGPISFILIGSLITVVGFPRIILSTLAGLIFGFYKGLILGLLASILGCIIAFYYTRFLGRDFIAKLLKGKALKFDDAIYENSFIVTLIIRLIPVGSNTLTNLVAGTSSIKALPFFLGSLIGYIPQALIFSLMGSGIRKDTFLRTSLSFGLLLISFVLIYFLYRRLKKSSHSSNI